MLRCPGLISLDGHPWSQFSSGMLAFSLDGCHWERGLNLDVHTALDLQHQSIEIESCQNKR